MDVGEVCVRTAQKMAQLRSAVKKVTNAIFEVPRAVLRSCDHAAS